MPAARGVRDAAARKGALLIPAFAVERTQELIEKEKCVFIVGGLAAHVQMAINEQTKKAKVLFVSASQSDEISAKPDTSPITFHEALNPTITCRAVRHARRSRTYGVTTLTKRHVTVSGDEISFRFRTKNSRLVRRSIASSAGFSSSSSPRMRP